MRASIAIAMRACRAFDGVNEYQVTIVEHGEQRQETVMAASASAAREQVEDQCDGEVIAVRFVRAASFSCAIRDGRGIR